MSVMPSLALWMAIVLPDLAFAVLFSKIYSLDILNHVHISMFQCENLWYYRYQRGEFHYFYKYIYFWKKIIRFLGRTALSLPIRVRSSLEDSKKRWLKFLLLDYPSVTNTQSKTCIYNFYATDFEDSKNTLNSCTVAYKVIFFIPQGICQLRLDFGIFKIVQPTTTTGSCDGDTIDFSNSPSGKNANTLCGTLTGMHSK